MLDLNIDPFSEESVLQQGEEEDVQASRKRPPKPTLEEMLQAVAQPKGSSPKQWRIVQEDDMLDLNINPFSEESVQQQGEEEDIQASWKDHPSHHWKKG